jgi:hypothetical protein
MNIHSILISLHVLSGVGIFMALGIEAVALGRLRRADTPAEVRTWMGLLALPKRLGPVTMLTTLATGVWMMAGWWGSQAWIHAALAGIVLMAVTGGTLSRRGMKQLGEALPAETGPELSAGFRSLLSNTAPATSLRLRMALGTGILGLMTMKTGTAGSMLILVAAVAAGLIAGIRPRTQSAPGARRTSPALSLTHDRSGAR